MNIPLAIAFIVFAVVLGFAVYHMGFRETPDGPPPRASARPPREQAP